MLNSATRLPRPGDLGSIAEARRPTPAPSGPQESVQFIYRDGIYELNVVAAEVGSREIKAWTRGETEFALVVDEPLIVLCYRFGDAIPWSLATFDWRHPSRVERSQQEASESFETRALLSATLADAGGQAVHAVRNVTLSLEFTRALRDAWRECARSSSVPSGRDRALAGLRRRLASAEALLARATARCFGSR